ncbi:hypothetical protein QAD02_021587 [Eretmocerus hayati]|uniref:Uncharacterized protein n=1 Tax=Eretmocerus hayati TaxID=131215 RepID=A0ACC2PQB6_9HYME|nr:hypothetical protein QAD02_021587 [Eretmocerus hayati]
MVECSKGIFSLPGSYKFVTGSIEGKSDMDTLPQACWLQAGADEKPCQAKPHTTTSTLPAVECRLMGTRFRPKMSWAPGDEAYTATRNRQESAVVPNCNGRHEHHHRSSAAMPHNARPKW